MQTNLANVPAPEIPASVADRSLRFVDFNQYLLNTADKIERIDADAELERLRLIVKMRKFYSGHQVGYVSKVDNRWVDKKKRGDALYVDPVLASFIDINVAQIIKSRPTIRVVPRSSDRVDKEQAALYAQELLKDAQNQLFTASFLQREAKLGLQLSGEAYRITWFEPNVRGTEIRIPITETKQVVPTADLWDCPACGQSGEVSEDNHEMFAANAFRCPQCDYWKVERMSAEPFAVPVITGYRDVPVGDVRCESPDPLEMKIIGDGSIGDALAVTRDRLVMRGVLEQMYKGIEIPSTSSVPLKLKYLQDLKRDSPQSGIRTDSQDSSKGGEQFELLHLKEVWLHPAAYGGYEFPKDTLLPELTRSKDRRTQVRAGTRWEDVQNERGSYKVGAYYQKVGNLILDIFPCDKRKHLVHCVNNISEGVHGLGEWDLLPLQEQKNSLRSLMFNKEKFDALSPVLARSNWIDPNKLAAAKNQPNAIIPVGNIPPEAPLTSAAARLETGPVLNGAYKLDEIIGQSMQYRTGASTLETGAPDMIGKQKTATAVNAAQVQAEGRRGPMLQLRAEMERDQGYQILELRQENWPPQMYDSFDRRIGGDAGRWFREADIRKDFILEVVGESWWPQTAEQRKEDLTALTQFANPNNPQIARAIWERATELYGRGLDLTSYQSERVEARIRLERLGQVANVLEKESGVSVYDSSGTAEPTMVQLCIEKARLIPELPVFDQDGEPVCVNPILDRHEEYIYAYSSWLLKSEGRAASPFVRAVVNYVIFQHYKGKTAMAQFEQAQQIAANAPAQAVQEQISQERQAIAAEEQALADEQAKGEMVQQAIGQQMLKERDREHQTEMDMVKTEHSALVNSLSQFPR